MFIKIFVNYKNSKQSYIEKFKGLAIFDIILERFNFTAKFYHIFNSVESAFFKCFKLTSQALLDNAKVSSETLKDTELRP
jgi:hypothetical protein